MSSYITSLKIGDKIVVEEVNYGYHHEIIKKITPTGIIKTVWGKDNLRTHEFDNRGQQKRSGHSTPFDGYARIVDLTNQEELLKFNHYKLDLKIKNSLNELLLKTKEKLTLEAKADVLVKIEQIKLLLETK